MDYDKWAHLVAHETWNYSNVLPYFKNSEKFTRTNFHIPFDEEYHGFSGPRHVTQIKPNQHESIAILETAKANGYDLIDYNGKSQVGVSVYQYFTRNGRRFDSAMAYIDLIKARKNLDILDKSYVTKIEIKVSSKKVEGVVFTRKKKSYRASCKKEVILSAGAILTPQILMLSGIGPKDDLEALNITVIHNLPVGKDLKEHPVVPVILTTNTSTNTQDMRTSVKELLKGEGPLTEVHPFDVVAFLPNQHQRYPNFEFFSSYFSGSLLAKRYLGWTDTFYKSFDSVPNAVSMYVKLLHPKSSGTIKLASASPYHYPLIDLKMLRHCKDVKSLYQGIQHVLNNLNVFRILDAKVAPLKVPGCERFTPLTKHYWFCFIRQTTTNGGDISSSCPMGKTAEQSVVDSKLKVFGLTGLRVADESVIPINLSGSVDAVIALIGEKAYDFIKDDWK